MEYEDDYYQQLLDHTYGHLKKYTYKKTNTKVDFYDLRGGMCMLDHRVSALLLLLM